jgi:hypothetical protein
MLRDSTTGSPARLKYIYNAIGITVNIYKIFIEVKSETKRLL